MSETLAVIITVVVTLVIQMLKPEWFIGWLITFLNSKLKPENSNKISNSLGVKFIETGIYVIESHPDSEAIKQSTNIIKTENEKIKDELKNLL